MSGRTRSSNGKHRQWSQHFDRWRRSGVSQREYCERYGLSLSTFQLWRRKLASAATEACFDIVPVPNPSAPASWSSQPPAVVLTLDGGYRIEVADGVKAETLHLVLDVLAGRRS